MAHWSVWTTRAQYQLSTIVILSSQYGSLRGPLLRVCSPPQTAPSPPLRYTWLPGASYLHRVAVGGRGDAFRTRLGMGSGVARSRSPRRHWLEPRVVVELVPPRRCALALAEKELLSSSRPVGGHGTVWCSRRIARKPRATERENGGASGGAGGWCAAVEARTVRCSSRGRAPSRCAAPPGRPPRRRASRRGRRRARPGSSRAPRARAPKRSGRPTASLRDGSETVPREAPRCRRRGGGTACGMGA